ncbi:unnamed protein product [Trifolium pratense]|uniref:Uncharacterized protein n=1 Tax=Trifolium pratense TaxID=57577 RepID=A0ACB0ITV7_TRIPR|nr:unnamed protein product [Trifolium pratense]
MNFYPTIICSISETFRGSFLKWHEPRHVMIFFNRLMALDLFKEFQLQHQAGECYSTLFYRFRHFKMSSLDVIHGCSDMVFNDPATLTEEELYDLRNRWATCFLDLYNLEVDYDDADEKA